jgi:hypothetical protein
MCPLCNGSAASVAESDHRLDKIRDLRRRISASAREPGKLVKLLESLLHLYDEEDLVLPKPYYLEIGTYAHSQLGNENATKKWASKAREGWAIVAGNNSKEVERLELLEKNPKAHPSWLLNSKRP